MSIRPVFLIGLRYIKAKRRNQFISFISGFSLLGIGLGTLALIVVLSVMNGFDKEIKQRILNVVPHIFIDQLPQLVDWQSLSNRLSLETHVIASAPYISGYVMLSSQKSIQGAELQGILPDLEKDVSVIGETMHKGSMNNLKSGDFGIVIGRLLARFLSVDIDDKIIMTLPEISITPAGLYPRIKRFTIVGIFEVGAQVDQSLAMIHLADAQKLLRYVQGVQGLRLKTDDIYQAQSVARDLQQHLGQDFQLTDWTKTQGSLFDAVQMEKRVVTVLLMIIITIAVLNILSGLILMVADKRADIAVLRTLGMSSREIMCIFIIQGGVVSVAGIMIGSILGCLSALYIGDIISCFEEVLGVYIFNPNVYFVSYIPSELQWGDVFLICGSCITMSLLATLYPAYCASNIEPAEVLRYE